MSLTNLTITSATKNYINNSTFDVDTTGYATYADAAATPVDGVGGSPTLTFAASATSPLRGAKSGLITAGTLGDGVAYAFSIDAADAGKTLTITFDYSIVSGSMVTGDYVVYVYDVTNSQMIQPYGYQIPSVGKGLFLATFPTNTTSTSYKLLIHQAVSSTANIKIDSVVVSATQAQLGMAGSDWTAYPMTIGATTTAPTKGTIVTDKAMWRRVGDSMEITYQYEQSSAGTGGSGAYLFPLPAGYTIDTTKLSVGSGDGVYTVGSALLRDGSSGSNANRPAVVTAYNSTNLAISAFNSSTLNGYMGQAFAQLNGATEAFSFTARIPIAGWSSNVTMAQSSTFRISSYLANGTRVTTTPAKLGEYRARYRASSSSSALTDTAPTNAPSASNGMQIYGGVNWGTAGTSGQAQVYDIFVGKGYTPAQVQASFYQSTGFSGTFEAKYYTTATLDAGALVAYDPSTGVVTVDAAYIQSGSNTSRYLGILPGAGTGVTSGYVDVVVSQNALAVGVQAPRSEILYSTPSGYGSTNTGVRYFTSLDKNIGTAFLGSTSSTLGTSVTILEDGLYTITYSADSKSASGMYPLISRSSTHLTSSAFPSGSEVIATSGTNAAGGWGFVSSTLNLSAGEVIRCQTAAGQFADGSGSQIQFRVTKVSN